MKALLSITTVFLCSIYILSAQTDAQIQAIEHYNTAVEALGTDDKATAVAALSKAINLDGKFYKAIYQRGLTYIQLGEYLPALRDLSNYIKEKPEDAKAFYYRGYAEMKSNLNDKAVISYTRALELDDTQEKAHYYRGYLFILNEKYGEAIEDMDMALANGYKSDALWKNKGLCHYKLEEYEAAALAYDRYIENNPDDLKTAYSKALALYKADDYTTFIPEMKSYLSRTEGSRDQYYMLANAHLKSEQLKEAQTYFDQVASIDPTYMPALKNNLYISNKLDDQDRMITDYGKLINVEGPKSEYFYKRGILLMKKEQWANALADISSHLENKPDHAEAYFNRASIYSTEKQYAEACEDMRQAARLGMESAFQYIPSLCNAAGN